MANPRRTNGHRRDQLRARKLASAPRCAWPACPWPDEPLTHDLAARIRNGRPADYWLDDRYPVMDEIVPIKYGGSPIAPDNTRLMHRWCNSQRGAGRQPPAPQVPIHASPGW